MNENPYNGKIQRRERIICRLCFHLQPSTHYPVKHRVSFHDFSSPMDDFAHGDNWYKCDAFQLEISKILRMLLKTLIFFISATLYIRRCRQTVYAIWHLLGPSNSIRIVTNAFNAHFSIASKLIYLPTRPYQTFFHTYIVPTISWMEKHTTICNIQR